MNFIAPDLSVEDKLKNIKTQMEDLVEMLEGAETCKWIYQRLVELALMSKTLNDQWPVEFSVVETWVDQLLEFDPLRGGRWLDLKQSLVQ